MNICIAGATGAVGFEAVKLASAQGHSILTLSRSPKRAGKLNGLAHQIATLDAASAVPNLEGMEVVVSCLGGSVRVNDPEKRSYLDVDLKANQNLLRAAVKAGVKKFIYVSVHLEPAYRRTRYIQAHEEFVAQLQTSAIAATVIRPTGIYSALADFVQMAKNGFLMVVGNGNARSNPIHEADVAQCCIDHLTREGADISIGGPEILTRGAIADLAFEAIQKPSRPMHVNASIMRVAGKAAGVFNPRLGDLFEFVTEAVTHDCVAPLYGTRRLADYFRTVAATS